MESYQEMKTGAYIGGFISEKILQDMFRTGQFQSFFEADHFIEGSEQQLHKQISLF